MQVELEVGTFRSHAMAGTGRHDGKSGAVNAHCREKRQAAKRLGKHHASSSEDNSDGAASDGEDSAGARADGDPFFQMEADPFSDPFFQVSPSCLGLDSPKASLRQLTGRILDLLYASSASLARNAPSQDDSTEWEQSLYNCEYW